MPRTCVVGKCNTGYKSQQRLSEEKISVFKFPKDDVSRDLWVNALPNVLTKPVTDNVGVCELHWPKGYETVVAPGGARRPQDPPSVWPLPPSFCRQTTPKVDRNPKRRNVTSECRNESLVKRKDLIGSWTSLQKYCKGLLPDIIVRDRDDKMEFIKLDGYPPEVVYSVFIAQDYKVSAYKKQSSVPLRDVIPSFSGCLEKYSQISEVITKVENYTVPTRDILQASSKELTEIIETRDLLPTQKQQMGFLSRQLLLQCFGSKGRRYSIETIRDALNIFLRSRSGYRELLNILALPNSKTLKSFFGKLGCPGSKDECKRVIETVFESLHGFEKHCKILIDEIHIKPAIRYASHHVIGFAIDDPTKPARTVLAIMVAPLMGKPAFVVRLLPMYSLKADFLLEQVDIVIRLIHESSAFVFLVMTDNLKTNQSFYRKMHAKYGSVSEWSIKHPIKNSVYPHLFLLYDPTHLFKNVRNNWLTEKTQSLDFHDPVSHTNVTAKWRDLVNIYKQESMSCIKMTNLDYPSLYPNNFEKQKVNYVVNIFNEKTVATLEMKGCTDSSIFVSRVTKMWHILNVKSLKAGTRLNDDDRTVINDGNDERLQYLLNMAQAFSEMNPRQLTRVKMLTVDTSEALALTLRGLVDLTKLLLAKEIKYVMLGEFQSDRLEGEFGIYRSEAGSSYFIAVEQVINGLRLQRLKLYHQLEFEFSNKHFEESCCKEDLAEEEKESLDTCFTGASNLSEDERAMLFYISGYVTFKECKGHDIESNVSITEEKDSEFLQLVSRGKLSLPDSDIFELSLFCFTYYKSLEQKSCTNKIVKAFSQIYDASFLEIEGIDSVLRRLANCFSKGYAKRLSDQVKLDKISKKNKQSTIKTRRMTHV